MRLILWGIVALGVSALCNDTRGAQWLAVPALIAGMCLLPGQVGASDDREHER